MDKAEKRFSQGTSEMRITFVPQCCHCKLNRGLMQCDKFRVKPTKYRKNEVECPLKESK